VRQQSKHDPQPSRLEGPASLENGSRLDRALALDEYVDRRLIQESVAGGVDELHAPVTQGIDERGRNVVGDQEGMTAASRQKLVDDGPQSRWAQATLDLGNVSERTGPDTQAELGIRAVSSPPCFPPQNRETQTERLHSPDGVGKQASFWWVSVVH
jgi:hypothetical protein